MENGRQRSKSSRRILDDANDREFFNQYNDDNKSNNSRGNPRKRDQKQAEKVD